MESAAKKIADALTFSEDYTVFTGLDDDNLTLPNVVCTASDTGDQIPKNSGNRIVKLRVTLNAHAADTGLDDFRADAKVLTDAFNDDTIGAQLANQEAAFYVYDPPQNSHEGAEPKEGKFTKYIELDLLACEVDI